jgi:hypothetical protein
MTDTRFAGSRGDGDISGDDTPRLWLAFVAVTLFGLSFAFLIVAVLTLRTVRNDDSTPRASAEAEQQRSISVGKSDRLPLFTPLAPALPSEYDAQQSMIATAAPSEPLAAATDEDIKQAEAEHHRRHRDICAKGRTYYMKGRYRYWRCNR